MIPFPVVVCGGRHYEGRAALFAHLDGVAKRHGALFVVEGGNPTGADRFAREWRADRLHPGKTYLPDWKRLGRSAGPVRNRQMLDEEKPRLVVAAAGGTGTANMVAQAEAAGVPVERVSDEA